MENKLINRKTYRAIKKYDRQQMDNYLENIWRRGFRAGAEASERADEKIDLVHFLEDADIKGVGPKIKENILEAYKGWSQ